MTDLPQLTPARLLQLCAGIGTELRRRNIVRTENITGDVAEYLFCRALSLTPMPTRHSSTLSTETANAISDQGATRHSAQSVARTGRNPRHVRTALFDYLAGLLFNEDFTIRRAAIDSHAVVMDRGTHVKRSNSHKFLLLDDIWDAPTCAMSPMS